MLKLFRYLKVIFYSCFLVSCQTYRNVPIQSNLFVGEELQTLNNGLLLQYINSKQAGISKKGKSHLLAIKVTNPTDSAIRLIPVIFQIRNNKGEKLEITNPFLRTKKVNRNGVVTIDYVLPEYGITVEKLEVKRNFPVMLEAGARANAEGVAAIGATNLLIQKIKQQEKKKRFVSAIFLNEIKPQETRYGWLLLSGAKGEALVFQINVKP